MSAGKNPSDHLESSLDEMQGEFRRLVESQRTIALWFMDPAFPVDLTSPLAERVLNNIAQRGSREVWLQARKLMEWRSHHIK